ncbi:MAG: hypothetical protein M3P49_13540 [Actinomycetota bacterium]|nr:hypothetical protein [Actinomycetota bacterium]
MNHLGPAQLRALEEASRDRLNFAARVEPVLTLAGSVFADGEGEFADNVESCSYGEEDGIGVVLTATVLGRLDPAEYEQEECRLEWRVTRDDGTAKMLPGFLGKTVVVERTGILTNITAGTEGYEAERTPLGESKADDREFVGFRPDTVLYGVLSTLPYAGIEMPRMDEPVLYARKPDNFSWTRSVKEVVEWVEEQAELRAADTPWNVASAYPLRPASGEAVWDFEQDRDFGHGDLAEETPEDERYYRVIVVRLEPDGTETKLAVAEVDNGERRVNPRSAKILPYEAENPDGTQNTRSAYAIAYEEAQRLSGASVGVSVSLNWPMFFGTRGESFSAVAKDRHSGMLVSTRYLYRADKISVDAVSKTSTVSGEGRVVSVEEESVEGPAFAPRSDVVGG